MEPNSSEAELSRSSIWRDSGREVFSTSFRGEEDDEESLKWAALEKLPTYDRVRKGILSDISGPVREIDVDKLGLHEKKQLLERLVKIAQQDHQNFLLRLRERIDRYLLISIFSCFMI